MQLDSLHCAGSSNLSVHSATVWLIPSKFIILFPSHRLKTWASIQHVSTPKYIFTRVNLPFAKYHHVNCTRCSVCSQEPLSAEWQQLDQKSRGWEWNHRVSSATAATDAPAKLHYMLCGMRFVSGDTSVGEFGCDTSHTHSLRTFLHIPFAAYCVIFPSVFSKLIF